jgi:hypothetical protein
MAAKRNVRSRAGFGPVLDIGSVGCGVGRGFCAAIQGALIAIQVIKSGLASATVLDFLPTRKRDSRFGLLGGRLYRSTKCLQMAVCKGGRQEPASGEASGGPGQGRGLSPGDARWKRVCRSPRQDLARSEGFRVGSGKPGRHDRSSPKTPIPAYRVLVRFARIWLRCGNRSALRKRPRAGRSAPARAGGGGRGHAGGDTADRGPLHCSRKRGQCRASPSRRRCDPCCQAHQTFPE